jgi:hypothetical protein
MTAKLAHTGDEYLIEYPRVPLGFLVMLHSSMTTDYEDITLKPSPWDQTAFQTYQHS